MTESSDPKSTPPEPTTAEPGPAYEPPALIELGSVRDLTQGEVGPLPDEGDMGSAP